MICCERGWHAVWLNKQTQEEADLFGGEMALPIVSWRSFRRCWLKHFPKLKVRAKGEDTCTDCYLLRQKLASLAQQKAELLEQLNDG